MKPRQIQSSQAYQKHPQENSPQIALRIANKTLTDFLSRLLDKIAKDIMVCENKTVTRWNGSIGEYKNHLRKKMMAAGGV